MKFGKKLSFQSQLHIIACLLIGLFFVVLWKVSPLGMYPDSGSYMSHQPGREPLYPLFLWFFRWYYNEKDTLVWLAASGALDTEKAIDLLNRWPALHTATLVQSILGALSCICLSRAVIRYLDIEDGFLVIIYGFSLIPYVVTPLLSSSHMVLGRAVLTEGLAFPLFGFFAAALVHSLRDDGWRVLHYLMALAVLFLLVLTRNQMLLFLPVWGLVGIFKVFQKPDKNVYYNKNSVENNSVENNSVENNSVENNSVENNSVDNNSTKADKEMSKLNYIKRIVINSIIILVISVLFMFAKGSLTSIYTRIVNEGYTGASTGPYNMLTTHIYLGDEETPLYIEDEGIRDLYSQLWEKAYKRGLTVTSAPGGILEGAYHYEDAYDEIGLGIQQPLLFGRAEAEGVPEGEALNRVIELSAAMESELFIPLLPRYIANYLRTSVSGLTRSVGAGGNLMGLYAICVYILSIALAIHLWRAGERKPAALMILALLMIGANAAGTALVIMCLSRYMIYNTPLFYMALAGCILAFIRAGKIKDSHKTTAQ